MLPVVSGSRKPGARVPSGSMVEGLSAIVRSSPLDGRKSRPNRAEPYGQSNASPASLRAPEGGSIAVREGMSSSSR